MYILHIRLGYFNLWLLDILVKFLIKKREVIRVNIVIVVVKEVEDYFLWEMSKQKIRNRK